MAEETVSQSFTGNNIAEAVEKAKQVYGADFFLISKREIRTKKSLFKLKAEPMVEIVAAPSEYRNGAPKANPEKTGTLLERTYGRSTVPNVAPQNSGVEVEINYGHQPILPQHSQTSAAAWDKPASAKENIRPAGGNFPAMGQEQDMKAVVRAAVHNEVLKLMSNFACGSVPPVGERFMDVYNHLCECGVDVAIARDLAMQLQYELGLDPLINEDLLNKTLKKLIAQEIHTLAPEPDGKHQPKIVSLIGPSGSGKTTTVVKLAFAAFSQQKNVGLITEDFNRPGAEGQLRALTQLMTLPLAMVSSPARLAEEIRNMQNMDLIIVDTAGRSIRDKKGLNDLRDNLAVAASHETHLVLPATIDERAAKAILDAYQDCQYNRILVSKLDEAVSFGLLLNLARKVTAPFTYLAMGQSFRNGFALADSDEMAKLVMGEDEILDRE